MMSARPITNGGVIIGKHRQHADEAPSGQAAARDDEREAQRERRRRDRGHQAELAACSTPRRRMPQIRLETNARRQRGERIVAVAIEQRANEQARNRIEREQADQRDRCSDGAGDEGVTSRPAAQRHARGRRTSARRPPPPVRRSPVPVVVPESGPKSAAERRPGPAVDVDRQARSRARVARPRTPATINSRDAARSFDAPEQERDRQRERNRQRQQPEPPVHDELHDGGRLAHTQRIRREPSGSRESPGRRWRSTAARRSRSIPRPATGRGCRASSRRRDAGSPTGRRLATSAPFGPRSPSATAGARGLPSIRTCRDRG